MAFVVLKLLLNRAEESLEKVLKQFLKPKHFMSEFRFTIRNDLI